MSADMVPGDCFEPNSDNFNLLDDDHVCSPDFLGFSLTIFSATMEGNPYSKVSYPGSMCCAAAARIPSTGGALITAAPRLTCCTGPSPCLSTTDTDLTRPWAHSSPDLKGESKSDYRGAGPGPTKPGLAPLVGESSRRTPVRSREIAGKLIHLSENPKVRKRRQFTLL